MFTLGRKDERGNNERCEAVWFALLASPLPCFLFSAISLLTLSLISSMSIPKAEVVQGCKTFIPLGGFPWISLP